MSRWAEFLGDDYMITHGRFVPYGHWMTALRYAIAERSGVRVLDRDDPEYNGRTGSDYMIPLLWDDAMSGLPSLRYGDFSGLANFVDSAMPIDADGERTMSLARLEAMIGPRPAAPDRFEPYTTEYLWWVKRALDCHTMRRVAWGQPRISCMQYIGEDSGPIGTTSAARAIARAEASGDWYSSGGYSTYPRVSIIYAANAFNEFYRAVRDDHVRYSLGLEDWPTRIPDAPLEVWIKTAGDDGRFTYWHHDGIPQGQWTKIEQFGRTLSQIQNNTVELFDYVPWPPDIFMGWYLDDICFFCDIRSGLEFYDPIDNDS